MATLGAMFKKIYGEAFAPYGFKKIKGKQPYFVRVIGDEIVHVITYMTRPREREGYKQYMILGGVATVYRDNLCLDETPRDNNGWLIDNLYVSRKQDLYGEKEDMFNKLYTFSYEEGNDESLRQSVVYSLEMTEKFLLSAISMAMDINSAMDYFNIYNSSSLWIYDDEGFGRLNSASDYNEGYLNLKIYNSDQYKANRFNQAEKAEEFELWLIEHGKSGMSKRDYEVKKQMKQQRLKMQIDTFEKFYNDIGEYSRIMEELERRKKVNVQKLREYGFDL